MTSSLDRTFAALAHPSRRDILSRLTHGPASVTELANSFPVSQPAISKHLKVLEAAGLIARGRDAQWRPSELRTESLQEAERWLDGFRRNWEDRLDRLDAYLAQAGPQSTTKKQDREPHLKEERSGRSD